MDPIEVMTRRSFDWSAYLQAHLTRASVVVSRLHPIMGLRLAALFVDLTNAGLASTTPGEGRYQILSGVRTRAQQEALYRRICIEQRRCGYVANPNTVHGTDAEGVQRAGSNHMAQRQLSRWRENGATVELGYAVDLYRATGAPWTPVHERLDTYGLDWPLKTGAVEPWHVEAFPRRAPSWLEGPVAWPKHPGAHRPLIRGMLGGDVRALQRQASEFLARPVVIDGVFGPKTEEVVEDLEEALGLKRNGYWSDANQRSYERATAAPAPAPPPPAPAPAPPEWDLLGAQLDRTENEIAAAQTRLTEAAAAARNARLIHDAT